MERSGTEPEEQAAPHRRPRPRFIFQVDSSSAAAVIRILDTESGSIFREIPVDEFLAFARESKDLKSLFFGPAGAALPARDTPK